MAMTNNDGLEQTMTKSAKSFLSSQEGRTITAVVLLVAAYLLGSRALDTGSWQQYGGTLLLVVLAVRQLVRAFHSS